MIGVIVKFCVASPGTRPLMTSLMVPSPPHTRIRVSLRRTSSRAICPAVPGPEVCASLTLIPEAAKAVAASSISFSRRSGLRPAMGL